MDFGEDDLRKARGKRVKLTLQLEPPHTIQGTLVYWRDEWLLLDSDTVVFEPATDRESHPADPDGTTAVWFGEIIEAKL